MSDKVEIYDNYKRPPTEKEKGGGPRITEASGYIPVRVQVEQMIQAGMRLDEYRKEKYDYPAGSEVPEDVDPDPTRSPTFDLADGTRIARETAARLNAAAEARKAVKEADAPANVSESPSASEEK